MGGEWPTDQQPIRRARSWCRNGRAASCVTVSVAFLSLFFLRSRVKYETDFAPDLVSWFSDCGPKGRRLPLLCPIIYFNSSKL